MAYIESKGSAAFEAWREWERFRKEMASKGTAKSSNEKNNSSDEIEEVHHDFDLEEEKPVDVDKDYLEEAKKFLKKGYEKRRERLFGKNDGNGKDV